MRRNTTCRPFCEVLGYLLLIIALLTGITPLYAAPATAKMSPEEETSVSIYKQASPSVVNITTTTLVQDFFSVYPQKGSGSGTIITPEGYVLTNYHVIEDASEIGVTMIDGKKYTAKFIGADQDNDIAVIKIITDKPAAFKTIEMGLSESLQVGQHVYAIGNPFGLNSTMTNGIVSALGRPLTTSSGKVIDNVIQTDAAINPGNSGGPLIDTGGKIIGITTAIFTPTGGNVGIGFAIPISVARALVPDLIKHGKIRRPWIGIVGVPLWEKLSKALGLPVSTGVLVSQVVKDSPAHKAGIKGGNRPVEISGTVIYLGGDIILEAAGVKINSLQDLSKALKDKKPNDIIAVKLIRGSQTIVVNCVVELKS
ncbi:S1C family serine protease [Candidatus Magnetominusculus xianensis]|uniref:Peptidase n=1 Tax=Candidatus Magnetominusculus xianensis TaxID=1748249 RepID=A0ABR5SM20_9BACT|nr:trypsin-like peptidase domain-containing protein [Candidatus Magnetominusculus xianensis]KWT91664.1 peptidase [Candidatus Magnetominusculus xianensis]MBF0404579.1 trypsin-like peptidase domain-containing protein [Nitrospirota bacterium]